MNKASKNTLTAHNDKSRQINLPQKTVAWLVIDTAVYDIIKNVCVYWGDLESCLALEWESDRFIALPL